jgi:hypothetical protein
MLVAQFPLPLLCRLLPPRLLYLCGPPTRGSPRVSSTLNVRARRQRYTLAGTPRGCPERRPASHQALPATEPSSPLEAIEVAAPDRCLKRPRAGADVST